MITEHGAAYPGDRGQVAGGALLMPRAFESELALDQAATEGTAIGHRIGGVIPFGEEGIAFHGITRDSPTRNLRYSVTVKA